MNLLRRILVSCGLTGAGAALAGGALAWHGNRELTRFELHDYTLPILAPGTLKGKQEFRILHIADLHMIPGQEKKKAWVSGLDALQPDLVVNTGDNLSDLQGVPEVIQALGDLLNRPGVFVFGSNDYWAPSKPNPFNYLIGKKNKPSPVELPWRDMRTIFFERGWHDATHQRCEFKVGDVKLAIAGVDDPHHNLDDYETIAGPPNPDADLSIALTHAPEPRVLAAFAADGYTLALAGHTHGGQLCLPGEHAIVTNCGIDRRRARGLSDFGGMILHVSNGLGTSRYVPFRLFCRPSAAILRITEKVS